MIRLNLSARQRQLITEYGYPFEDLEKHLLRLDQAAGVETLTIDPFSFDHLLADLVRSAKELTDETLLEELDALYTELEMQAHGQVHRTP